jgi:tetratricopeptide (TPR) repeat protein
LFSYCLITLLFLIAQILLAAQAATRKQAEQLLSSGASLLEKADYREAASRFEKAASIFTELHDVWSESTAVNQAGLAYLYQGTYARARGAFQRALSLDARLQDNDLLIEHLNNSANVSFFEGNYSTALDQYRRGLSIANDHSGQPWAPRRIALTSLNLAVLYEQVGQNRKALTYYKEAQRRAAILEPAERGQLLSNLGTLLRRLGDPTAALAVYRDAQRIFWETRHADSEIHVLENIGITRALDFHNFDDAIRIFTEALSLAERNSNQRQIRLAHLFRGEALLRRGSKTQAEVDFNLSLAGARAMNAREEQWTALWGIGRLARERGDAAAASQSFTAAIQIIESLRSGLRASTLRSEFLGNKRDVYDAEIEILLEQPSPDRERIFRLLEQARERAIQDRLRKDTGSSLAATQRLLRPEDVLLAYWVGKSSVAIFQIGNNAIELHQRSFDADQGACLSSFANRIRVIGVRVAGHSPLCSCRRSSCAPTGNISLSCPMEF